jgi:plastocyanin
MQHRILFAFAVVVSALALGRCGGYSDPPTSPGGPSPGEVTATITIRSDGRVEPAEVRISVGDRVRFINQDTRQHQPTTNPHLVHTDCPAGNLPVMSTGESQTTQAFTVEKACGFHDHLNPDSVALQGVIRVGNAQGPGGPVY